MAQVDAQSDRSRQFARALLELAESAGRAGAVGDDLDSLAAAVSANPDCAQLVDSPLIAADAKFASLQRVFGPRVDELTMRFLHVLAEHDALPMLRVLGRAYAAERDRQVGRLAVEVTIARPMDERQRQVFTGKLAEALGSPVILEEKVDPSLIGGLVLRIGDTLFDGSVRQQLNQLRRQVIARGQHEIQGRRDLIAD